MITGRLIFDILLVILFASIFAGGVFCFNNWRKWKGQKSFWYLLIIGSQLLLTGGLLLNNYLRLANEVFAEQRLDFFIDDSYWSIVGAFLKIVFIAVMIYGINQLTIHLMPIPVKGKKRLVKVFSLIVIILLIFSLIFIRIKAASRLFLDAGAVVNGLIFPMGCLIAGIQSVSMLIPSTAIKGREERKESFTVLIILSPFLLFPIADFIWFTGIAVQSYVRLSYFAIIPLLVSLFMELRQDSHTKKDSIIGNDSRFELICSEFEISEREKDVLKLLITGYNHQNIADSLCISINTVKSHLQRIYKKMAVSSKIQLLLKINSVK